MATPVMMTTVVAAQMRMLMIVRVPAPAAGPAKRRKVR